SALPATTITNWSRWPRKSWPPRTSFTRSRRFEAPLLGRLLEHLARELSWTATGDVAHPWATEVDGAAWRVRLNDFPDHFMYSLAIGGVDAGDFHDWPETWRRESRIT